MQLNLGPSMTARVLLSLFAVVQMCLASDAHIKADPVCVFPQGTVLEQLATRSNGNLLVTLSTAPELWQVYAHTGLQQNCSELVHRFPGFTSAFGLTEIAQDNFIVVTSNQSGSPDYIATPGSVHVWSVAFDKTEQLSETLQVEHIVNIPPAELLDGIAAIPGTDLVAGGDVKTGSLYVIDTVRKTFFTALSDSQTLAPTSDRSFSGLGVNGFAYRDSNYFFTNSAKSTYGKIPMDPLSGRVTGRPQILKKIADQLLDDLTFDTSGNAFITEVFTGVYFLPAKESPYGATSAGTGTLIDFYGANSCAFGVTPETLCTLYMTSDGLPGVGRADLHHLGYCGGSTAVL